MCMNEETFFTDRKAVDGNQRLWRSAQMAKLLLDLVNNTYLEWDDEITQQIMKNLAQAMPVKGMVVSF